MTSTSQIDNALIISSSPHKPIMSPDMSSSPLPSPSELFGRRPAMSRSGSDAMLIHEHASASFPNALKLPRKDSFGSARGIDTVRLFTTGVNIYDVPDEEPLGPTKTPRMATTTEVSAKGVDKVAKVRKAPSKKNRGAGDCAVVKKVPKPRVKKAVDLAEDDDNCAAIQKPRSNEGTEAEGIIKGKAQRKPRAKKVDKTGTGEKPVKEKVVRKSRVKNDAETQAKLPLAQVTKPTIHIVEDATKSASSSKHFSVTAKASDSMDDNIDFGLVEAVKRRNSWTPPRPSYGSINGISTATSTSNNTSEAILDSIDSQESSAKRPDGFRNLLENFGYNSSDNLVNSVTERRMSDGVGIKKRKLTKMLSTSTTPRPTSPTKTKKKSRTLTGLAVSAYVPEEESPVAPILQYFSVKTTERIEHITKDGFKLPGKPRAKNPVKRVKKGSAEAPILLSPESAIKKTTDQDFVFGTSSQLAREESPGYLKDLHAAMQASNVEEDDSRFESPFRDPFNNPFNEPADQIYDPAASNPPTMKRTLWSAASRDSAGDLLDIEMVNMASTPIVVKQTRSSSPEPALLVKKLKGTEVWHDSDDEKSMPARLDVSFQEVGLMEDVVEEQPCIQPRKTGSTKCTSNKNSPRKAQKTPTAALQAEMPKFEAYTDLQLTKAITANGFKAIKKRSQMITLLEKCWESEQSRQALGSLGTNSNISSGLKKLSDVTATDKASPASQAASSKRPKGRPRKVGRTISPVKPKPKTNTEIVNTVEYLEMDSDTPLSQIRTLQKKNKMQVEEIYDSEDALTPSPPRISQKRVPLPLKSLDMKLDSPELSLESSQLHLFTQITNAVISVSPSKDSTSPTWHEKILLFDPIVLEDLTVWLNTGGLEKAGWDGEVEPKEVKRWCESRSICCLWKENLRGGARNRY